MTIKWFGGCDPGWGGSFAVISEDLKEVELFDFPDTLIEFVNIWEDLIETRDIVLTAVEQQHAAGFQGASRTFRHGENFGIYQAAMAFMRLPHILVAPKKWQYAVFDGIKRQDDSKLISIANATRKFPNAAVGKNHNRADCLNLCLYSRKTFLEG